MNWEYHTNQKNHAAPFHYEIVEQGDDDGNIVYAEVYREEDAKMIAASPELLKFVLTSAECGNLDAIELLARHKLGDWEIVSTSTRVF